MKLLSVQQIFPTSAERVVLSIPCVHTCILEGSLSRVKEVVTSLFECS